MRPTWHLVVANLLEKGILGLGSIYIFNEIKLS